MAWRHAGQAAVCDRIESWEYGTVVTASAHPDYWDYNVVRVEEDPEMTTDELIAFADEALEGLAHRRIDFDDVDSAAGHAAEFERRGWRVTRLLWMLHEEPVPAAAGPEIEVETVPYDGVNELRVAWFREDFDDFDPSGYFEQAKAVALARGAEVLAVRDEAGAPVSFAQLEHVGDGAEISQVFVHPGHRGAGRGTAMTRAAIAAAGTDGDLWIVADADDRPKDLYARLGFRTAAMSTEITLMPQS